MGITPPCKDESVADLHFRLLGPLQVWRGEVRVDSSLPGRLTRELLALLLLEHDRFVPAERLMEAFWPELGPSAAANNLQVTVRKLRHWLEPGLRRGRDSQYLLTEGGGYRLWGEANPLDIDEFAQAAQRGQAALRAGDLASARPALERARQLYRGELLADLPYAEWAFPMRERLREAHLKVLEALGLVYLRQGQLDAADVVGRQALAIDPLRETFVRLLMQSNAARGQAAEALAAFDGYQRLLSSELGKPPSPETQRLRDDIQSGTLPGGRASVTSAPQGLDLPLAGREATLARLREAVRNGAGLVLLAGEAGMGKSRLLTEFARSAPEAAMGGQAYPGAPPLSAVLALVEAFLAQAPPASRLAALGSLGPPLAQRLPAVRQLWTACPPYVALTPEAEQQRLHQAVLAALRLAAQPADPASSRPLFVLDDLHWADEASLVLLADLLRQPAGATLVCAYRVEEMAPGSALAGWLVDQRAKAKPPLELALGPLSSTDVLAVVQAVTVLPDPRPFSQRLYAVTGGHPLFLAETLRGLVESGWLFADEHGAGHANVPDDLNDLPLTATLREAVLARAARLAPFEREVLEAAAVLRPHCGVALLSAMLGAGEGRLAAALENLDNRRLLVSTPGGELAFGHHLIGEVLYVELSRSHRSLLHRLAAGALIAATPLAPAAAALAVVGHLELATTEPATLARWAVAAGQWALDQSDYQQAERCFALAQAQLTQLPESDEWTALAQAVHEGLGRKLAHTGQPRAAAQALERALAHATAPRDRARLLLAQANVYERDAGEYDRALAALQAVEAVLAGTGLDEPRLRGEMHLVWAGLDYGRGDSASGVRHARLAVGETAGTALEVRALQVLAINLQKLGQLDEALALYDRVLALCQAAGNLRGTAIAEVNLGNGLTALGRLAEAQAAHERAMEAFTRLGHRRELCVAYANAGLVALDRGSLDRAEAWLRHAIAVAEEVGAPFTLALAQHNLGKALALRGRWDAAREALEAALATASATSARVVEAHARLHYAQYLCWPRGDAAGARAHAAAALAIGEPRGDNFTRREGSLLLGAVLLAEGDTAAAEAAAQEARSIASAARQVLSVGRAERLLARVAAAREAFESAQAHLDTAEGIFRQAGAEIELGQTLFARAEMTRAAGDPAVACQPWLLEARRLFRRSRAHPLLKTVEKLLNPR